MHVGAGVRHLRGSVAGISVTGGATVAVQGVVSGAVGIDRGAKLCVDGSFAGELERNDGLLVVAGQATLDLTRRNGRLGLAVGSVIRSRDRVFALGDDGLLHRLQGLTTRLDVDADDVRYFDNAPPPVADDAEEARPTALPGPEGAV
ncbi:MAG TPA: hypothetical protein VFM09_00970 [Marmoricola sp.]|nr:hypothetical protein [Marmoricola sp.]